MFVLRVNLSSPPRRLNYPVPCGPQTQRFHLAFMVSRIVKPIGFPSKSQILNFVFRFGGPFFRWFVLSSPWIDRFDSQNCPKSFTLPKLRRLLSSRIWPVLNCRDGYYHFFSNTTWSSAQTRPLPIKSTVSAPKPLCGCACHRLCEWKSANGFSKRIRIRILVQRKK